MTVYMAKVETERFGVIRAAMDMGTAGAVVARLRRDDPLWRKTTVADVTRLGHLASISSNLEFGRGIQFYVGNNPDYGIDYFMFKLYTPGYLYTIITRARNKLHALSQIHARGVFWAKLNSDDGIYIGSERRIMAEGNNPSGVQIFIRALHK